MSAPSKLLEYCLKGDLPSFQREYNIVGGDPTFLTHEDSYGWSYLHIAASLGRTAVLEFILNQEGVDVEKKVVAEMEVTALHLACEHGAYHSVRLLVEHGANVSLKDSKGYSPIWIAASQGHVAIVHYLYTHGANIDDVDASGRSVLVAAAKNNKKDLLMYLAQEHSDTVAAMIDKQDDVGGTPLHACAAEGSASAVRWLLAHGAKSTVYDDRGRTAHSVAIDHRHLEVAHVLLDWTEKEEKRSLGTQPPSFGDLVAKEKVMKKGRRKRSSTQEMIVKNVCRWELVLCVVNLVFYMMPLYNYSVLSELLLLVIGVTAVATHMYCDYSNPGHNQSDRAVLLRKCANGDLRSGGTVCYTCGVERAIRSKHCPHCDVCVLRMDHHCMWAGQCVGLHTHPAFFVFLVCGSLIGSVLWLHLFHLFFIINPVSIFNFTAFIRSVHPFFIYMFVTGTPTLPIFLMQLLHQSQIVLRDNILTNEMINFRRYPYLLDGVDSTHPAKQVTPFMRNPFKRSVRENYQAILNLGPYKRLDWVSLFSVEAYNDAVELASMSNSASASAATDASDTKGVNPKDFV